MFQTFDSDLVIKFDNVKAANYFKTWLCEQGEQDYWTWMEYREQEEKGKITAVEFDYQQEDVIVAKCGRLEEE